MTEKAKILIINRNNLTEERRAELKDGFLELKDKGWYVGKAKPVFVKKKLLGFLPFYATVEPMFFVKEENSVVLDPKVDDDELVHLKYDKEKGAIDIAKQEPIFEDYEENPKTKVMEKVYYILSPRTMKASLDMRIKDSFTELKTMMLIVAVGVFLSFLTMLATGYQLFFV